MAIFLGLFISIVIGVGVTFISIRPKNADYANMQAKHAQQELDRIANARA